ncbi:hypothetical protein BT96DRAFT_951197 [Gymnopus androsaceus JB14]|uniref:Essential protein Yae1 N-terminal domain-containing protein n=1 Tax=Gymnopus androsaceus JB14 TaxID=1447944 RepID=A0A6A4GDK9_9AGAR|nr:hypothetical protein BT96DRAFT_951197 [Gymnopus androsaceus JB14]
MAPKSKPLPKPATRKDYSFKLLTDKDFIRCTTNSLSLLSTADCFLDAVKAFVQKGNSPEALAVLWTTAFALGQGRLADSLLVNKEQIFEEGRKKGLNEGKKDCMEIRDLGWEEGRKYGYGLGYSTGESEGCLASLDEGKHLGIEEGRHLAKTDRPLLSLDIKKMLQDAKDTSWEVGRQYGLHQGRTLGEEEGQQKGFEEGRKDTKGSYSDGH